MLEIAAGIVIAWLAIQVIEFLLRGIADLYPRTFAGFFNLVIVCALAGLLVGAGYGIWKMIHALG